MFGGDPNIEGELGPFRMWATSVRTQSGALSAEQQGLTGWAKAEGDIAANIEFNASQGNSIYSGSKVQVSALQTLVCIKT